jgi:putative NIF3 family GTP cyclohydrolase 1 type 2
VNRVAVCGGSGISLLHLAIKQKADVFITGDVTYHQFFSAENKIVIADIGHYESEKFTKNLLSDLIIKKFPSQIVRLSQVVTNPIQYFTSAL